MNSHTPYRGAPAVAGLLARIRELAKGLGVVRFMEFCGGHTHAIARHGLRSLLPDNVRLSSGPGCPVCVTSSGEVDLAISLAEWEGVTIATFGDMVRVPGSAGSLSDARARGADVRVVYSSRDALEIARQNSERQVVFLGVGFEPTSPGVAASILEAAADDVPNFTVLSLHKLTPPAVRAVLDSGELRMNGIIGPGHVSAVLGADAWGFLPGEYRLGCAIAGFEPTDVLMAVADLVAMVATGRPAVANSYGRAVSAQGNQTAKAVIARVFEVTDREWRGLGGVPSSGLQIRPAYSQWDAVRRFGAEVKPSAEPAGCRCGEVLCGTLLPLECSLFGRACTPSQPVGPCMVSSEGACAAYFLEADLD